MLALTGGTGFLGARIGVAATAAGWRVRALARPSRDGGPRRLPFPAEIISGDLSDPAALDALTSAADLTINNAGLVRAPSRQAFFEANQSGARSVAEAARRNANPAAAFLLISSLAATRPEISDYAASKAAGEAACRDVLAGRPMAILRPPAIYGPNDTATKPLFDAIRFRLAPTVGPRRARLAMIHVDDAAQAALAAARAAAPSHPVFEADDGGGGHRWSDIAAAAEAAAGRRLLRLPLPGPLLLAAGAFGSLRAALGLGAPFMTLGKAREALAGDWTVDPALAPPDWSPAITLRLGFSQTLTWYREHGWRSA